MAEVRILLDPGDDMRVSVGLLERHDPARGQVTVHPTPGTSSTRAFAHDLLGALGRAVNRIYAEQLAGDAAAWRAAAAWMAADQVQDLAVLRADRLSARVWTLVLELCRNAGCRVLLVCHTPQVPAHLGAVLAGVRHELLAGLPQAPGRGARPHPGSWPDAATGTEAEDLPLFLWPHVRDYRRWAFSQLGPAGFARTDAVYRHGRDAACRWLSTRTEPASASGSGESLQLFLTWLAHDSPSRRHTLARLRGAQAGFLLNGFKLGIPPSQRVLDVLSGPGLDAPPVTARVAARIRAGTAHPVIAAGIAVVLVAGVEPLALATTPWEALSAQCDTLRLTWRSPNRTLMRASEVTARTPAVTTALFHMPAAARPLLHAARHFSRSAPGHRPDGRLFAETRFSNDQLAAAAANCKIRLPAQQSLEFLWQTKVTCARAASQGAWFDASFADDQAFDPAAPAPEGRRASLGP